MGLPKLGDVVDDRYLIEAELGRGAMGVVFSGRNVAGDFPVAIKWLLPALQVDSDAQQRFLQEARLAAKVRSRNVVRIYDVGVGQPYFVMEQLRGVGLREVLSRAGGPLAAADVAHYLPPILDGVQEAHLTVTDAGRGVIHRDLKPDNVFLSDVHGKHVPIVLDFGIARLAEVREAVTVTTARSILGTPAYMAKEQLFAPSQVGPWTDVHAIAVMLYEMLAGRRPFDVGPGQTIWDLAIQIGSGHFEPLVHRFGHFNDPWWQGMDRVLSRAMAPEVRNRYPSIEALREDLEPLLHKRQLGAGTAVGAARTPSHLSRTIDLPSPSYDAMSSGAGPPGQGVSSLGPVAVSNASSAMAALQKRDRDFLSRHRGKLLSVLSLLVVLGAGAAPLFLVGDEDSPPPSQRPAGMRESSATTVPATVPRASDETRRDEARAAEARGSGEAPTAPPRGDADRALGDTPSGGEWQEPAVQAEPPSPSPHQKPGATGRVAAPAARSVVRSVARSVASTQEHQPSSVEERERDQKPVRQEKRAPAREPTVRASEKVDPITRNRPGNALDAIGRNRPGGASRQPVSPQGLRSEQPEPAGGDETK